MNCATCGGVLTPDAKFCSRCGAKVELGSLLGVGTDLPPVQPRDVAERPRDVPERPSAAQEQPDSSAADGSRQGGDFTPGRVAAMVATFVVLTVLGTFVLAQLFGSDPAESPTTSQGAPPASDTGAGSAPATASPTPSGPGTTSSSASPTSPTATSSPTASASPPEGARRCSRSGSDSVASAWSGNRDTSCAFTNAVRAAYREAGAPTEPTPFRVYSTVTKRWYDVTCTGSPLLRCADGAAVVYLGP